MYFHGQPLAVCFYYVRQRQCDDAVTLDRLGQRTAYGVWWLRSGTAHFQGPDYDFRLSEGGMALTDPGWTVQLSAGSQVVYAAFDVAHRARFYDVSASGAYRVGVDSETPIQPTWSELVGLDVPALVMESHQSELQQVIKEVHGMYWVSLHGLNMANGLFQTWLVRYLADLVAEAAARHTQGGMAAEISRDRVGHFANHADKVWFQRCVQEIGNQLAEPVQVATLAVQVGLGEAEFRQKFQQIAGQDIDLYIENMQMGMARQLLQLSGRNVDAVAQRVGFSSSSAFTRCFKKYFELSPAAWRRQHAEMSLPTEVTA